MDDEVDGLLVSVGEERVQGEADGRNVRSTGQGWNSSGNRLTKVKGMKG